MASLPWIRSAVLLSVASLTAAACGDGGVEQTSDTTSTAPMPADEIPDDPPPADPCPDGTLCNGECVDTFEDPQNCGGCGISGDVCCGGVLVDLDDNGYHCGSCFNNCGLGVACVLGECWAATSYNATDVPLSIPDDGSVTSELTVADAPPSLSKVQVTVSISHTWAGDIDLRLRSPSGLSINLSSDNGTHSNAYLDTTFDDDATDPIQDGPFANKSYRPEQSLSTFTGEDPNGVWSLQVDDDTQYWTGSLQAWSITIE